MTSKPSAEVLAEHVGRLITRRLLDPVAIVLESDKAVDSLRDRVANESRRWAATMLDADREAAVRVIVRLIAALYPSDEPFDPPRAWWDSPLGWVVAWRLGHPSKRRVPYETAGAMLGITRQGVGDLVNRGKLRRHPDGGVDTDSIRERIDHLR